MDLNEKFAEGLVYELQLAGMEKEAIFGWLAGMAGKLRGAKAVKPPPPSLLQQGVAKMKRLEAVKPDALREVPPKAVNHPNDPEDVWGASPRDRAAKPPAPKPQWKPHGTTTNI